MKEKQQDTKNKNKVRNISLTTLGWELALPIFGGALLGFHLDKVIETNYILTFMLLVGGIFIGYYNLVKLIELEMLRTKAANKHQQRKGSES